MKPHRLAELAGAGLTPTEEGLALAQATLDALASELVALDGTAQLLDAIDGLTSLAAHLGGRDDAFPAAAALLGLLASAARRLRAPAEGALASRAAQLDKRHQELIGHQQHLRPATTDAPAPAGAHKNDPGLRFKLTAPPKKPR